MNIEAKNSSEMPAVTDAILENLLDAVLLIDNSGDILYANRAAQDLFSLPASELAGKPFGFPILPYEMQEIEVVKTDRLLTVQMLASHIVLNGQPVFLLSLRDITAQKKAHQDLLQQKFLLEKTNEENAQYASLASHDLKEPIRKILIFADRLLGSQALHENERKFAEKIQSSARRMKSLVESVTQISKISHIKRVFTQVDLKSIVDEVVDDLELQINEKGAKVSVSSLPTIEANSDEMYQLFLNLISNALKYSKDDVAPHIQVTQRETDYGYVCIECSDNGIGFDNQLRARLFQAFQRLHHKKSDGMGIGLTLCQKIVDVHNGQIIATGVTGEGAVFTIRLPIRQMVEK